VDNNRYAEREIVLAKSLLESNPSDQKQLDRLAFWLSYLGRYEEASEIQVSDKIGQIIDERRNNLPV
jgi:hypothetical protein